MIKRRIAKRRINKLGHWCAALRRRNTSIRVYLRGQYKLALLEAGLIQPRIGDFGHGVLGPMRTTGFVVGFGRASTYEFPVCQVRVASGEVVAIPTEDMIIRSPREWRQDWLKLGYRYRSEFYLERPPVKLIWGAPQQSKQKKPKVV